MPETATKCCLVAVDTEAGPQRCEVRLPARATIAMALAAARQQLGPAAVDWEQATAGIYGRVRPRDFVYADGDRVELYRPLPADPKVRRRERSRQAAAHPGKTKPR